MDWTCRNALLSIAAIRSATESHMGDQLTGADILHFNMEEPSILGRYGELGKCGRVKSSSTVWLI